jgi:membrane-anchored glycerophosphoryl diester phosphodiesterase (GDPDase)
MFDYAIPPTLNTHLPLRFHECKSSLVIISVNHTNIVALNYGTTLFLFIDDEVLNSLPLYSNQLLVSTVDTISDAVDVESLIFVISKNLIFSAQFLSSLYRVLHGHIVPAEKVENAYIYSPETFNWTVMAVEV